MKILARIGVSLFVLIAMAVNTPAQSPTVSTYVGPSLPSNGAQALTQAIDGPGAIVLDGGGGYYVASAVQNWIYRVAANGTLTLIAGSARGFGGDGGPATAARLSGPLGLALDGAGNLYIADYFNNRIRKVTSSGTISTVVGTGTVGFGGDGGPATAAQLNSPYGLAMDAAGNLYIADTGNNRIRKVTASGTISTVAGTGIGDFAGDGGVATAAKLNFPIGAAFDSTGNLYIADQGNNRIRKVTPGGVISTVAGNGTAGLDGDGGPATSAQLYTLSGVAADGAGNIYIADSTANRIRKVTPDGVISTLAGSGKLFDPGGFGGDGQLATSARIFSPAGLAVDTGGNVYFADSGNNRVRKITPGGVISTVAGNGIVGYAGDGGPATSAQISIARDITFDTSGNLYIADRSNNRIRKVTPGGVISTVAGNGTAGFSGDGQLAISGQLSGPTGVAVDAAGNLYIVDAENLRIRKVTTSGIMSTVAGTGVPGASGGDGGPAVNAQFITPYSVVVDAAGNLYISENFIARIRKVTPAGVISTFAGTGTAGFSGDGGPAASAQLNSPWGMALDAAGNLYIADSRNNVIRKVTPAGVISTVAGNGRPDFAGDGGPATAAALNFPAGVAVDAAGNLYIADSLRIRKVTNGVISTFAGNGTSGYSGEGDLATASPVSGIALAVDGTGNVYFATDGRIGKISSQAPFTISNFGGVSISTPGGSGGTAVGYGRIQPNNGSTTPAGLAIFGFRQGNVLVSEAGVPASPAIQSGRIYAEINAPVNTGLAIANPNNQTATISFYFTGANGNFNSGTTTIPANGQIAAFLDQPPFNGGSSVSGTFTFSSTVPLGVVALRGFSNERGEFLITTLPVVDLSAAPAAGTIVFPHFADGGGWTTQVVLVNPTDSVLTGTIQFVDQSGNAVTLTADGQTNSSFTYSIPARSSQKLRTSGLQQGVQVGSVRAVPTANNASPAGVAVFSFRANGVTVSEAGVPATKAGSAFRLYAEASGDFDHSAAGSIQTGLAISDLSNAAATVTLELNRLDGSSTGLTGSLVIPANGQAAKFLNQIQGLSSLTLPFQGVLRVSSASSISLVGLRGRYNERTDFLITTTPPVNESVPATSTELIFPHFADAGGYTTQFILFSGAAGQLSSGALRLFSQSGQALSLTLR